MCQLLSEYYISMMFGLTTCNNARYSMYQDESLRKFSLETADKHVKTRENRSAAAAWKSIAFSRSFKKLSQNTGLIRAFA